MCIRDSYYPVPQNGGKTIEFRKYDSLPKASTPLDVYKRQVYMRATTNPGGIGHGWVKARFITPAPPGTPIVEEYPVRMPDGTEMCIRDRSFARIGHTLRHLPEDKQVFWFLLAFFC